MTALVHRIEESPHLAEVVNVSQALRLDPVVVATENDPVRRAWRIAAANTVIRQRQQAQREAEEKRQANKPGGF